MLARVIHQDATHGPGGGGQEMRPVMPFDAVDVHHANVCLVDERRRTQRVASAFATELA
jgi:hypothetical protein